MGLFDSTSVKDYSIHLSSTSVRPGQMLSGNLVFTLTSEVSFRSLSLKVVGREFTQVKIQRLAGRIIVTRHYRGKRNFKVHITPLGMPKWGDRSWKGTLAPGAYNFPFAVLVPHDALPSMCVGAGTSSTASIEYFVKTKIDIAFGPNGDVKVPFTVTTAMAESQVAASTPYFAPPARVPRTCCCCCKGGFTTFTFSVDHNLVIFSPLFNGGFLNGHITVDNSQSKDCTRDVVVSLSQHTTMTAEGYTRVVITPLSSVTIPTNMGKRQQGEQTFPFQISLVPPAGELQHPPAASFKGELMMNAYLLTFVCDGDSLGQLWICGASAVDASNVSLPVQCDTISGRTVPHAHYPRFLYSPPPNSEPLMPRQTGDVGPFPVAGMDAIPF